MAKPTIDELMYPSGGGGAPNPEPPKPATTDIKPGDGEPKPADLSRQQQNPEPPKPNPEPPKPAGPAKTQAEIEAENLAKGLNADGTPKTEEQKKKEEEEEQAALAEDEADQAIWPAVDKLWGRNLEVSYKGPNNEDIHPNDPEGIFLREQAVAARAVQEFEAEMEKRLPRAYAFLLHSQAGGDEADFFAHKTVTLPAFDELQNSVDLQLKVYTDSLRVKGLDEAEIKVLADTAQRDKKLQTLATTAYKATEKSQQDEIDRLAAVNAANDKAYQRSVQQLSKALDDGLASEMKIIVPDAKKIEFGQFVRQHVIVQDGQFMFAQPIDPKSMGLLLDQLFFAYSKGNMGDLIQRSATTQNTIRLRAHHKRSEQTPTPKENEQKRKLTLGEL